MTRQDGSSLSTPSGPTSDGDYTRKLALAILSTLQSRGLLSAADVDAILIAARRSAHQAMQNQPIPKAGLPLSAMQVTAQPSPSQVGVSWQTTAPPGGVAEGLPEPSGNPAEAQETAEASPAQDGSSEGPSETPGSDAPPAEQEKQPPMFDIKLD
jgi:hypothetical protein